MSHSGPRIGQDDHESRFAKDFVLRYRHGDLETKFNSFLYPHVKKSLWMLYFVLGVGITAWGLLLMVPMPSPEMLACLVAFLAQLLIWYLNQSRRVPMHYLAWAEFFILAALSALLAVREIQLDYEKKAINCDTDPFVMTGKGGRHYRDPLCQESFDPFPISIIACWVFVGRVRFMTLLFASAFCLLMVGTLWMSESREIPNEDVLIYTGLAYQFVGLWYCCLVRYEHERTQRRQFEATLILDEHQGSLDKQSTRLAAYYRTHVTEFQHQRLLAIGSPPFDHSTEAVALLVGIHDFGLWSNRTLPVTAAHAATQLHQLANLVGGERGLDRIRGLGDEVLMVANLICKMSLAPLRSCSTSLAMVRLYASIGEEMPPLHAALQVGELFGSFLGLNHVCYDVCGPAFEVCRKGILAAEPNTVLVTNNVVEVCGDNILHEKISEGQLAAAGLMIPLSAEASTPPPAMATNEDDDAPPTLRRKSSGSAGGSSILYSPGGGNGHSNFAASAQPVTYHLLVDVKDVVIFEPDPRVMELFGSATLHSLAELSQSVPRVVPPVGVNKKNKKTVNPVGIDGDRSINRSPSPAKQPKKKETAPNSPEQKSSTTKGPVGGRGSKMRSKSKPAVVLRSPFELDYKSPVTDRNISYILCSGAVTFADPELEEAFFRSRISNLRHTASFVWLGYSVYLTGLLGILLSDMRLPYGEYGGMMILVGVFAAAGVGLFPQWADSELMAKRFTVWRTCGLLVTFIPLFGCALARPSPVGNDPRSMYLTASLAHSYCFRSPHEQLIAVFVLLGLSVTQNLLPGGAFRASDVIHLFVALAISMLEHARDDAMREDFARMYEHAWTIAQLDRLDQLRIGLMNSSLPGLVAGEVVECRVPEGIRAHTVPNTAVFRFSFRPPTGQATSSPGISASNERITSFMRMGDSSSNNSGSTQPAVQPRVTFNTGSQTAENVRDHFLPVRAYMDQFEALTQRLEHLAMVSMRGDDAFLAGPLIATDEMLAMTDTAVAAEMATREGLELAAALEAKLPPGTLGVLCDIDVAVHVMCNEDTQVIFSVLGVAPTRLRAIASAVGTGDSASIDGVVISERVFAVTRQWRDWSVCINRQLGPFRIRGVGSLRLFRVLLPPPTKAAPGSSTTDTVPDPTDGWSRSSDVPQIISAVEFTKKLRTLSTVRQSNGGGVAA